MYLRDSSFTSYRNLPGFTWYYVKLNEVKKTSINSNSFSYCIFVALYTPPEASLYPWWETLLSPLERFVGVFVFAGLASWRLISLTPGRRLFARVSGMGCAVAQIHAPLIVSSGGFATSSCQSKLKSPKSAMGSGRGENGPKGEWQTVV